MAVGPSGIGREEQLKFDHPGSESDGRERLTGHCVRVFGYYALGAVDFTFPVGYSITIGIGDFNGDGIPDILAGSLFFDSAPIPMEIRLGRGDGTFEPPSTVPLTAAATSIRVRDFDRDGDLDALVSDFYYGPIQLLAGRGDGTFDYARVVSGGIGFSSTALTLGDINGDGLVDMIGRGYQHEASVSVYRQTAAGNFSGPVRTWSTEGAISNYPHETSLADLDLDGRLDLVAVTHGSVSIGMGNGFGGFGRRAFFGQSSSSNQLVGDVDEDGWPDIVLTGTDGTVLNTPLRTLINQFGQPGAARGFPSGGAKTVPVGVQGRDLCLRVEPVAGSYDNANVDLGSFTMRSEGTGSVETIAAIRPKKSVLGDEDRNGIEDVGACFSAADLGALFSEIRGRRTVTVTLEGRLIPPGRFQAQVTLTVLGTAHSSAPRLSPNPLNPAASFHFTTTRPGEARIRVFDVRGRLVRNLLDRPLKAGDHAIPFDGKDRAGSRLASGIYFATVESAEGSWRVRVAILK